MANYDQRGEKNSNWKGGIVRSEYIKEWRKRNPNYDKEWRERTPDYVKYGKKYRQSDRSKKVMFKRHLKKMFGITIEQYDELMFNQGNRCGICATHQSKLSKRFDIDHDHSTGKVRGLLCNRCNQAIGLLRTVENVAQAVTYLRSHNGR